MHIVAAAAFVPPTEPDAASCLAQCARRIRERGWHLEAVARDPDTVAELWAAGRIQRIVVARLEHREHLMWAVEVVEQEPPPDDTGGGSRPHWTR